MEIMTVLTKLTNKTVRLSYVRRLSSSARILSNAFTRVIIAMVSTIVVMALTKKAAPLCLLISVISKNNFNVRPQEFVFQSLGTGKSFHIFKSIVIKYFVS